MFWWVLSIVVVYSLLLFVSITLLRWDNIKPFDGKPGDKQDD